MPSYNLYYFNGRGRAEICRMLFTCAGIQFTDVRLEYAEWRRLMSRFSSPMLPILEIDSKTQMPQSMAIARFLAREFGYHGRNSTEMVRVDFICQSFYEILDCYMKMYHEKDGKLYSETGQQSEKSEDKLTQLRCTYEDTCNRTLPFLERTLQLYNNGNQYFLGDQMLMCDMMGYATLENPVQENPSLLNEYPKLQALMNRVSKNPKLSSYLEKRTITDF